MAVYKGKDAKILINATTLGYVDSATCDIGRGTEGYYEVGSPEPRELVQGNTEITGSISRVWMDTTLASLVGTTPAAVLTSFDLVFKASTTADGSCPLVSLTDCRLETASIDISQDGYVMGDIDFLARSYLITTVV